MYGRWHCNLIKRIKSARFRLAQLKAERTKWDLAQSTWVVTAIFPKLLLLKSKSKSFCDCPNINSYFSAYHCNKIAQVLTININLHFFYCINLYLFVCLPKTKPYLYLHISSIAEHELHVFSWVGENGPWLFLQSFVLVELSLIYHTCGPEISFQGLLLFHTASFCIERLFI